VQELTVKEIPRDFNLELTSLLEITLAINNNLPEDSLYKIFYFTLKANLQINKFVVYSLENEWKCNIQYGVNTDFRKNRLPSDILASNSIVYFFQYHGENKDFAVFDIAIPVAHKNRVLAYIFLGWPEKSNIFFPSIVPFLRTVSNIILVAIENKKLARNQLEQERMKKELEIASTVQTHLFPKRLPHSAKLQAAAKYLPHQSVGGDYYDFMEVGENKYCICIGDVSGKGIPAALLMSNFQASLRTMIRMGLSLYKIIEELNYQIYENTQDGTFITFFVALLDLNENKIHYVNAGHNPPILLSENHQPLLLELGTTILGPIRKLPFVNEGLVELLPHSVLFLYTDGLVETESMEKEQFGMERTLQHLSSIKKALPHEINTFMVNQLDKFRAGSSYFDDITLFTCKIN
jgi:sigma-B regulation protein RsbU (phosphoserine phosphatase)